MSKEFDTTKNIGGKNMKGKAKTIMSVLIILTLAATVVLGANEDKKIVNGTVNTSESKVQITGSPPWDSLSTIQWTNTNNMFMKIEYVPNTEWIDIEGYFDQPNYFQLPINVKFVNGSNAALKYKNIYANVDEYKMWYEGGLFKCNCWKYEYLTSYFKSKNTGSSGNVDFLYSFKYRGHDRTFYKLNIYHYDSSGKYVEYYKNLRVAWYINTAGYNPATKKIS